MIKSYNVLWVERLDNQLKAMLNRWDLSLDLNTACDGAVLTLGGRLFHLRGSALLKALSPQAGLVFILGTRNKWSFADLVLERKAGLGPSCIYYVALPFSARYRRDVQYLSEHKSLHSWQSVKLPQRRSHAICYRNANPGSNLLTIGKLEFGRHILRQA